ARRSSPRWPPPPTPRVPRTPATPRSAPGGCGRTGGAASPRLRRHRPACRRLRHQAPPRYPSPAPPPPAPPPRAAARRRPFHGPRGRHSPRATPRGRAARGCRLQERRSPVQGAPAVRAGAVISRPDATWGEDTVPVPPRSARTVATPFRLTTRSLPRTNPCHCPLPETNMPHASRHPALAAPLSLTLALGSLAMTAAAHPPPPPPGPTAAAPCSWCPPAARPAAHPTSRPPRPA